MASTRNLSVDIVRLVAVVGVILIHLTPPTAACGVFTRVFSLFAVPLFLLISLHFFINKVSSLTTPALDDLRLDRLLVPYVVWGIIYTLLRFAKFHLAGKPFDFDWIQFALYGGVAVQMYFIPLLLLFQGLALAVLLLFRTPRKQFIGLYCFVAGTLIFGLVGKWKGYPYFEEGLRLGAAYVGLAFSLKYTQATSGGRHFNVLFGWLMIPLIVSTALWKFPLDSLGLLEGPLVGYAISGLALNWHCQISSPLLRFLVTCSYGTYLAHFGFLESFEFLAARLHLLPASYSISAKLIVGGLIFLCCVAFIGLSRRHWLSAYLFLGEGTKTARQRVAQDRAFILPAMAPIYSAGAKL